MRVKIIIGLCLLTSFVFYSFSNNTGLDNVNVVCTCPQVTNIHKASRAGNYVSIAWDFTSSGTSSTKTFTYIARPNSGGGVFQGTTGGSQITILDNNQGGTITITTNCADNLVPFTTCQSDQKNGTWTSGN